MIIDTSRPRKRETWNRHFSYFLSVIGYAVGIGNLSRFPYILVRFGGGAFLIPYIFFYLICGIPLFLLESAIGQYARVSPLSLWDVCPLFKGVAWGMIIVSGIVCIYYNMLLTWTIYYLISCFTSVLPWSDCGHWWNTEDCANIEKIAEVLACRKQALEFSNLTETEQLKLLANSSCANVTTYNITNWRTPTDEFWHGNVLELSGGVTNWNGIRWQLLLCLVAAWALVYLCICKGIKSVGKVVYVTATSPYVFLLVLLVRGLTLPGAMNGILYYVTPDWSQLLKTQTWAAAAMQVFISLGPGWGGLITMSSYNKFHNNVVRDSIVIPLVDMGTSLLGGFVVFSVMGHMSELVGKPVNETVQVGPALAFIAYPEAIARLPGAPIWGVLFFLMLITLGIDSQFGMLETLTSGFVDEFPHLLAGRKTVFILAICIVELLIGLPFITRAGYYLYVLVDWYAAAYSVTVIALLECVVLAYIYGGRKLCDNIEEMVGHSFARFWWLICWYCLTPLVMLIALIVCVLDLGMRPKYGAYDYPTGAIVFGAVLSSLSVLPIPIVAFTTLCKEEGPIMERLRKSLRPKSTWAARISQNLDAEAETQDCNVKSFNKALLPDFTQAETVNML